MKTKLLAWFGISLSLVLVVYIFQRFDMGDVMRAIALADLRWMLPAGLLYLMLIPLRGWRWAMLLRHVKPVHVTPATEVFLVGFMANNVMPARLGDVARAFVLARREGIPATTSFSTVMLERLFDGVTVVGMLMIVLAVEPPPDSWVSTLSGLMALIFFGAIAVCALVSWNEARALRLASALLSPAPQRVQRQALYFLERLAGGLHTLRRPIDTLKVITLSIVIWSGEVTVYVIAQHALGLNLSVLSWTLVMAVLTLGLTAPSAPGFVGVYEGIVIAALNLYGVGSPAGPAFAITMHVVHYFPGTLLGLLSSWRSGLHIRELKSAARNVPGTVEGGSEPPPPQAGPRPGDAKLSVPLPEQAAESSRATTPMS